MADVFVLKAQKRCPTSAEDFQSTRHDLRSEINIIIKATLQKILLISVIRLSCLHQ